MSRSVWTTRRERAAHLLREAPHAEEMLAFYVELIGIQEGVAERVPAESWLATLRTDDGSLPLRPERVPNGGLPTLFERFLSEVAEVGTDVVREGARALLATEGGAREAALAGAVGFHVRAFLEPVWTTLAGVLGPRGARHGERGCPMCGSLPVLSLLQDLPDALGARSLVCPLCATAWRVDRLRCAACGESTPDRLQLHTAESVPWVRVDECLTCRSYLKTIDLRQRGDAVPIVDELATIELDVWARERGLTKVQVNVLEL